MGDGEMLASLIPFGIKILILLIVFFLIAGGVSAIRSFFSHNNELENSSCRSILAQDPVLTIIPLIVVFIIMFYVIKRIMDITMLSLWFGPFFMILGFVGLLVKILIVALTISVIFALVQYVREEILGGKS